MQFLNESWCCSSSCRVFHVIFCGGIFHSLVVVQFLGELWKCEWIGTSVSLPHVWISTALILFVVVVAYVVVHCIFVSSVLRCSCITVVMAAYEISLFLNCILCSRGMHNMHFRTALAVWLMFYCVIRMDCPLYACVSWILIMTIFFELYTMRILLNIIC